MVLIEPICVRSVPKFQEFSSLRVYAGLYGYWINKTNTVACSHEGHDAAAAAARPTIKSALGCKTPPFTLKDTPKTNKWTSVNTHPAASGWALRSKTSHESIIIYYKHRNLPVKLHLMWQQGRLSDATSHTPRWHWKTQTKPTSMFKQIRGRTHTHTPCIYIFVHSVHSTFLLGRWLDVFTAQWLLIGVNTTLCVPWRPEKV